MPSRILTSGLLFITLFTAAAVGLSSPVLAANSISQNSDGTVTISHPANITSLFICPSGTTPACSTAYLYSKEVGTFGGAPGSIVIQEGTDVKQAITNVTVQLPAGAYVFSLQAAATVLVANTQVTIGSGGDDGGASSGAVATAPVEVSLSLDLAASGASCKEGSAATGVAGAWLTLPGADDCSSTTNPDAKLLGWSTSANFPVAVAQSQVDKGWGAIDDTFNGVRMIFIPAGKATLVSGPNSLHPIWAS